MISAEALTLDRVYLDESGAFALVRTFVKAPAGTDVSIAHNLGWTPKQAFVVSSEGKAMACYLKVVNGSAVKDTKKMTLRFSDTNAICTLRIE